MEIKDSTDDKEESFMQSADERWSNRSDAWTREDDDKLADVVLSHIRTGSTQLKAFEEAATILGRTAAACGYRWNGVLRKDRRADIEQAKQERKSVQRRKATSSGGVSEPVPAGQDVMTMTSSDSMNDVIKFLQAYDEQYQKLRLQVSALEEERNDLQSKLARLEHDYQDGSAVASGNITTEQLEQDSQTLFAIMERARKILDPHRLNKG